MSVQTGVGVDNTELGGIEEEDVLSRDKDDDLMCRDVETWFIECKRMLRSFS